MASVISDPNGRKRIQFIAGDGNRKTIRLGKATLRQAEAIKVRVEQLALAATGATGVVDDDIVRWLAGLDDPTYGKLAAVGLVAQRENTGLGEFIDRYIQDRTDVKPTTTTTYTQARRHLTTFFGAEKPLREITEADADLWRLHLIQEGLAEASVRKFAGIAKQLLKAAVKRKLVTLNPFSGLESSAKANKKREYFVSRHEIDRVLAACPDAEWRLIVGLVRYGGVRCPSEVLTLTWGDVHWEQGRITIHSPKTEHHEGGESRLIPLFPELLPYLQEVFDEALVEAVATEGTVAETAHVITRYRQRNSNLRTQFKRIIRKAGLKPWPRLFQNMRSTRETELAESFPLHVVTAWLGNSQLVARKHYLQVTEEHFARAAQNAAHSLPEAQKKAQQPFAMDRTQPNENCVDGPENADCLVGTSAGASAMNGGMGDEGIEPSTAALRVRCSTD